MTLKEKKSNEVAIEKVEKSVLSSHSNITSLVAGRRERLDIIVGPKP